MGLYGNLAQYCRLGSLHEREESGMEDSGMEDSHEIGWEMLVEKCEF